MNGRMKLAVSGLVLAFACGPGSDVNGFPSAYVQAYCHLAYHCCTPVERVTFPTGFANEAQTLGFDNEGDCVTRLSASSQSSSQPVQASVKDKRIVWSQTLAQACITALQNAGSKCDAQALAIAINGDPSQPGTKAVCNESTFITGQVAASGACTISQDCSGAGSLCTAPTQTGGGTTIQAGGTCTQLPVAGQQCPNGQCQTGDSCCNTGTCVAYVASGGTCVRSVFGTCSSSPCGSGDYCGSNAAAGPYTCQAKIAGGQPCGVDQGGATLSDSCLSNVCQNGSCTAPAGTNVTYKICTGNPDGL
jgi:hypothetical protein